MPGIILHDEDVYRLAQSVNTKQTEGYAPMGGILANNGMYYQPMVTGSVTAQYVVVREQESQNFIARSETTTGTALGDIQYVDGFFLQAFGEEPGGGAVTVAWGDITGKPAFIAAGASASAARSAIGAVAIGTTAGTAMDGATQLTGIGGTLTIAKGGTGATTAAAAWTALGGGAVGKLASLPAATTAAAGVVRKAVAVTDATSSASTVPAALAADADLATTVTTVNAIITALTAVRSNSGSSVSQLNALLAALRTALVVS